MKGPVGCWSIIFVLVSLYYLDIMLSSRADRYYRDLLASCGCFSSVDNHVQLPAANLRHSPSPTQSHGTSAISHVASRLKQPSSPTPADVFWRISIRYTVVAMFPLPQPNPLCSPLSALEASIRTDGWRRESHSIGSSSYIALLSRPLDTESWKICRRLSQ